jgi:N-acyl-D-amino-acid deacylase
MQVIIRNADVLDGSGSPAIQADIGLDGDRIAAIGDLSAATAETTVDGTGLTAAPGFIDMHSHSDRTLPINPRAESKIRQGVTTEVIGMCGSSPAPLNDTALEHLSSRTTYLDWDWTTFGEYLDTLRRQGISVNLVPMVGHGTIRSMVIGLDARAPTADEMAEMKHLVAESMDGGAWGLSTGLIQFPGVYASTEELIELCRVPAERGGYYFTHIRGEDEHLLDALAEAIQIGEQAGLAVQIAHLKTFEPENWPLLDQALALIDDARARGVDLAADRYPYAASSTNLAGRLPAWSRAGGPAALAARLQDPETRQRILAEVNARPTHWDKTIVASMPSRPELEGVFLTEIAEQRGVAPDENAMDLLIEAGGRLSVIDFFMSEDNLKRILNHPAVMVGSDGSALVPEGPLGQGKAHPRSYGAFPRVLGKYVREEKALPLPKAVYKMTGLPAERMRLTDRGRLAGGLKADVVLFNAETVMDKATFTDPYQYPVGIEYVFVNGQAVITPEGHTGALPGEILAKR